MHRLIKLLLAIIPPILGVTFIGYGVVKIAGAQFIYDEFVIDSRTVSGPTLVWTFYGYSPVYGRLIGLAELVAGVLVLIPRTRVLGALLVFPIAANITVMDFLYGFPAVKYFALLLTIITRFLLVVEWRRRLLLLLRLVLTSAENVPAFRTALRQVYVDPAESKRARTRLNPALRYGAALGGAITLLFFANIVTFAVTDGPEAAAIEYVRANGYSDADITRAGWSTNGWAGFNTHGHVTLDVGNAGRIRVKVARMHGFTSWQARSMELVAEN